MKKILTILLFVIGLQAFSQTYVPNQFLYNWTRGAEFSGDVIFSSLTSGTDTIFLVVNSATGTIDTIGITELKSIFSSTGVSRSELGDSTTAVRTDLTEDILLRLEIADTSGMLNTYSRIEQLGDTAAVLRGLINAGGGGSGGLNDTIIISGNRDTILNTHEEVLFLSLSSSNDTLYLNPSLSLDSLSNVYYENPYGGDLIIIGGVSNTVVTFSNTTGSIGVVLTLQPAEGGYIKSLGQIDGTVRFSAFGAYAE